MLRGHVRVTGGIAGKRNSKAHVDIVETTIDSTLHKITTTMNPAKPSPDQVILASAPWPLFNYPSIQLGTLKAYLKKHLPDVTVAAHHLYLKVAAAVGYEVYREISKRSWLAESIYASLLYPQQMQSIQRVFNAETRSSPLLQTIGLENLSRRVEQASHACLAEIDWQKAVLLGFSVCLCQFTSSIFFLQRIKQRIPSIPIVIGGSNFTAQSAGQMLTVFPQVDFIIVGEGELPLTELVQHHREKPRPPEKIPSIDGVVSRQTTTDSTLTACRQVQDLSALPIPDFDDYFKLLKRLGSNGTFFPTLPFEISRGCWWKQSRGSDNPSGCAFCNLNVQWQGYRSKHPQQVAAQVDQLSSRHKTFSVAFTDNVLPTQTSTKIFTDLSKIPKDLRLFAEIRAATSRERLQIMRAAGIEELQVGIEALSTRLLAKMNKGTTAIQNLQTMKYCEELGIRSNSNLILCFPGSDEADVQETLRVLQFALCFRPLKAVQFWLGLGSPVWLSPGAFGISARFNHPNYRALLPAEMVGAVDFMIQGYRGNLNHQKKIWKPVQKQLKTWKAIYAGLHKDPGAGPALSFRTAPEFMIITQRQHQSPALAHRLEGRSREIYLYCAAHRSLGQIRRHFPSLGEERLLKFLQMMVDKRLMFAENGRYLSLACAVHPGNLSGN